MLARKRRETRDPSFTDGKQVTVGFSVIQRKKAEDEVPYYVSLQDGVFGGSHILIFSVSRSGCYSFIHHLSEPEKNATLAEVIVYRAQFSYLRLSVDMAMTKRPKYFLQSQNCVVDYKKYGPNSQPKYYVMLRFEPLWRISRSVSVLPLCVG